MCFVLIVSVVVVIIIRFSVVVSEVWWVMKLISGGLIRNLE